MSTVEPEVMTSPMALARVEQPPPLAPTLFGTTDPVLVIEKAATTASALKAVVKRQGLLSNINGKEYPRCEAWTLLGTMLGIFPVLCWSRPIEGGWEARVEARTRDGSIVGAAEAQCLHGEKNWSNRDDFALRSMAQTRATAKALRMPLGFVMTLAGYEATPAEEMSGEREPSPTQPKQPTPAPKPTPPTPSAPAGVRRVAGTIEKVTEKTGTSARGEWTKFGVKLGDAWFNTFDKKLGEAAKTLEGSKAVITFSSNERGNTIVTLTTDPPPTAPEQKPDPNDDVPF